MRLGDSLIADMPTCTCGNPYDERPDPEAARWTGKYELYCPDCDPDGGSCEECGGPAEYDFDLHVWVCDARCTEGEDDSRRGDR